MTFWNFVGGYVLFSTIRKWLSGNRGNAPVSDTFSSYYDPVYERRVDELQRQINKSRKAIAENRKKLYGDTPSRYSGWDADDLVDLRDSLEDELDACDDSSYRYDYLQNELDIIENQLDEIEEEEFYDDDF